MNDETAPTADDTLPGVSTETLEQLLQEKRSRANPDYGLPISPRLPAVAFEAPFDLTLVIEQLIMASRDGINPMQMLLAISCLLTRLGAQLKAKVLEAAQSRQPGDLLLALRILSDAEQLEKAAEVVDLVLAPGLRIYYRERAQGVGTRGENSQLEQLRELCFSRDCLESLGLDPDEVLSALRSKSSDGDDS